MHELPELTALESNTSPNPDDTAMVAVCISKFLKVGSKSWELRIVGRLCSPVNDILRVCESKSLCKSRITR